MLLKMTFHKKNIGTKTSFSDEKVEEKTKLRLLIGFSVEFHQF